MLSNVMFYLRTSKKAGCWDWWNLQKNMREFQIIKNTNWLMSPMLIKV